MIKKTLLTAMVVLAVAGCQGKSDFGTHSDDPLPPDGASSSTGAVSNPTPAPMGDPAAPKNPPATVPPGPESTTGGPTAGGNMTGGMPSHSPASEPGKKGG